MSVREASTTSVGKEPLSSVHLMDIIPDSSLHEQTPLKFRHKMGRAAVDRALGIKFNHLVTPIQSESHDLQVNSYESVDLSPSFSQSSQWYSRSPLALAEKSVSGEKAETSREEKTHKSLGRLALNGVKWADSKVSALAVDVISKLPGAASKEEMYEKDRLHREKFAKSEDHNILKQGYYAIRRNQVKIAAYTPVAFAGAIALERIGVSGLHLAHYFEDPTMTDAIAMNTPVESQLPELPQQELVPKLMAGSSVYVAGGAGQGDIPQAVIDEMHAKGMELGVNIEGVHYSGNIGPVVGTERMDVSGAGGANTMYNQSIDDLRAGKPVQYVGYSEGTLVAIDAYDRAVAANGGVPPANLLPPILVAAPYAQGGIFDNSLTGGLVGNVLNGMGIPTDRKLPPGTIIKYYDTDIYANGGNMNPATLIKNAIGLAVGNHEIPNDSDPHYSFTDSDGVIHVVYSRDEQFLTILEKSGIKVLDTENANKAFEAFFPIGKDANGEFLKPDVRAGLNYMATAMDHQIDPSGNLHPVQDFMNSLPDEYKELGQRSMDGFNNIAEMAGKIQSGEVDPFTGFMSIMGSISSIMGGLQGVSGGSQGGGISGGSYNYNYDWSSYSASFAANYRSGQDYNNSEFCDLVQEYFGQFKGLDTSVLVTTHETQPSYGYNTAPQTTINDTYPYGADTPSQPAAQLPQESSIPTYPQYEAPVAVPVPAATQPVVEQAPVSVPEANTPAVSAPSAPAPAQEVAPTAPPEKYVAPVTEPAPAGVETAPAPVVEQAPAPVVEQPPAPAVEAPAPAPEPAPVAPPPEAYTPPPAPEPAPVIEAPAPAPVVEAPVFQSPPAPAFEIPHAPKFPSFSFGSGSNSGSSSSSSSSSSASTPSLVTTSVSEFS